MSHQDRPGLWSAWLPVALVAAGIFLGSSVAGRSLPPIGFAGQDKLVHLGEYGLLGFFARRALGRRRTSGSELPALLGAAALAFAFGLSDEFHQSFVPGRSVEAFDVLADVVGGATGAAIRFWIERRRARRSRS
jgi:VanZ family protein